MNGKVTYNSFRSPKPDVFVGTLTLVGVDATTGSASAGTMKPWVSSVGISSNVHTVTFAEGVTFPTTPCVQITTVSTNGTTVKVFPVITEQYTNSTRTLKFKMFTDGGTATDLATDLSVNITIIGSINGGS